MLWTGWTLYYYPATSCYLAKEFPLLHGQVVSSKADNTSVSLGADSPPYPCAVFPFSCFFPCRSVYSVVTNAFLWLRLCRAKDFVDMVDMVYLFGCVHSVHSVHKVHSVHNLTR